MPLRSASLVEGEKLALTMTNKGFESSAMQKDSTAVFAQVAKMELQSHDENGKPETFTVNVNPETYTRKFTTRDKGRHSVQMADGQVYVVKTVEFLETVSFSLWFDGTGVIPESKDVAQSLKWLESKLVRFDGDMHATRYVTVVWGALHLEGQIKSLDIDYQYFDQNGMPLRAKASIVVESITGKDNAKTKKSPDLTRQHTVQAGETLPLLCQKVYKDPSYYIQVAEANNLPHFTNLEPGQKIYFPPLV